MLRYNHGVIEGNWRAVFQQKGLKDQGTNTACTFLIPDESRKLSLENARLLVLTDFFAKFLWRESYSLSICSKQQVDPLILERLGVFASSSQPEKFHYNLGIMPRDFQSHNPQFTFTEKLSVGRLLHGMELTELLSDFGGDALRIYFLFLGPVQRDYSFNWHSMVSAYRFVTKVWRLSQSLTHLEKDGQKVSQLQQLTAEVEQRVRKNKTHTALSAIMGYLKDKQELTKIEVEWLAEVLVPFTPFLSAELAEIVASV